MSPNTASFALVALYAAVAALILASTRRKDSLDQFNREKRVVLTVPFDAERAKPWRFAVLWLIRGVPLAILLSPMLISHLLSNKKERLPPLPMLGVVPAIILASAVVLGWSSGVLAKRHFDSRWVSFASGGITGLIAAAMQWCFIEQKDWQWWPLAGAATAAAVVSRLGYCFAWGWVTCLTTAAFAAYPLSAVLSRSSESFTLMCVLAAILGSIPGSTRLDRHSLSLRPPPRPMYQEDHA